MKETIRQTHWQTHQKNRNSQKTKRALIFNPKPRIIVENRYIEKCVDIFPRLFCSEQTPLFFVAVEKRFFRLFFSRFLDVFSTIWFQFFLQFRKGTLRKTRTTTATTATTATTTTATTFFPFCFHYHISIFADLCRVDVYGAFVL